MAAVGPQHAPRRRVTQGAINKMAELRKQGVSYQEIGARLGCSERTVRRYVGHVQPQLQLPGAVPVPEVQDPRRMREILTREFSDTVYDIRESPQPSLSVAFMSEATKLIEAGLERVHPLTLELMMKDVELRKNFLRATVSPLFADFKQWVELDEEFHDLLPCESAVSWRPFRERSAVLPTEDEIVDIDWLEVT